ncbi:hypothetical protein Dimus_039084 [Dionaea muscipula]
MSSLRTEIPCFTEKSDFCTWKKKMRALLSHEKLLIALEKDVKKWNEEQLKKVDSINDDAYSLIVLNLSDTVLRKVDGCETVISLWDKLETLYARQSAPSLAYLKGTLFSWKMDVSKSLDDNLDEFMKLILILKGTDQAIDDTSQAMILLQSLPTEYDVVKNSLKYSGMTPTVELVISGLKARELELNIDKRTGSDLLFVKGKQTENKFSKGNQFDDKKKKGIMKCSYCGKTGHVKNYCYSLKNKLKNHSSHSQNSQNHDKNGMSMNASALSGFSEVLNIADCPNLNEWVLDSGCCFHMCPNKDWFTDFIDVNDSSVFVGNNNKCMIHGIGNIPLKLHDGSTILLTKVRYIPDLKRNLISLGMLDDLGCSYSACTGYLTVYKNAKPVLSGVKKQGIYVLNGCYSSAAKSVSPATESVFDVSDPILDDDKSDFIEPVISKSDLSCSVSEFDSDLDCLYTAFGFETSESFDKFLKDLTLSIKVEHATSLDEEGKLATFKEDGKIATSPVEDGRLLKKLMNNESHIPDKNKIVLCHYVSDNFRIDSHFDSKFPCAYLILHTLSAALTASADTKCDFSHSNCALFAGMTDRIGSNVLNTKESLISDFKWFYKIRDMNNVIM